MALFSCTRKSVLTIKEKEEAFNKKSIELLSEKEYSVLYRRASDTLNSWYKNNLIIDTVFKTNSNEINYVISGTLDSIICLNMKKDKLIGVQLIFSDGYIPGFFMESVKEFFGAKIDDKWYFWTGGEMAVGRESYKNHDPTKPLSYYQLHRAALESFLGGYLTKEGEINDDWFHAKFKGPGYGRFQERYKYKWILDGNRIDDEKDYYNYLWKRNGLSLWIGKATEDSIEIYKKESPNASISKDNENEIYTIFTHEIMSKK